MSETDDGDARGYKDGDIRAEERGFSYDLDALDRLGIVRQNGVVLIHDRRNGRLIVERERPSLEQIKNDLEALERYE